MTNKYFITSFANLAFVLFVAIFMSANFAVFATDLEYNQLQLKNGKVLTFTSFGKADTNTLKVILFSGTVLKISRKDLSEKEARRRFGNKFGTSKNFKYKPKYGKAYFVKSKLPKDFDPDQFKKMLTIGYDQLKSDVWFTPFYAMKYYKFVPNKENIKKDEKVPLVVFLHGMTDQKWMDRWPQDLIFVQDEVQKEYPCYFMAPMLNETGGWCGSSDQNKNGCTDKMQMVIDIIDDMIETYLNLDEDRIYITGLSSGGLGAWEAVSKFPGKFAGAFPVAGG